MKKSHLILVIAFIFLALTLVTLSASILAKNTYSTTTTITDYSTTIAMGKTTISFSGRVQANSVKIPNNLPVAIQGSNSNSGPWNKIATASTTNDGKFTGTFTIPKTSGTYYIQAYFATTTTGSNTYTTSTSNPKIITLNTGPLDHFTFDTIGGQQVNTPFIITITAKDKFENTITSYNRENNLCASTGTIIQPCTGHFTNGIWTGTVTLSKTGLKITITTTDGCISGTSNCFAVGPKLTMPEYTFGGLLAVAACFAALIVFKNRKNIQKHNTLR